MPGKPAARRNTVVAPPTDPAALVATRLDRSGLPGATGLRRTGARLGLASVRDLLFHLPRRYDDLREMRRIGDLVFVPDGTVVSARVRVADLRVEASFRRRIQRTIATLEDETGRIEATWFGRRFIERRLRPGDEIVVSGRLRRFGHREAIDDPEFARVDGAEVLHAGRIVPVYRLTAGLTAPTLRRAIRVALDRAGSAYPEYLPPPILAEERLPGIGTALEEAHYPTSFEARDRAIERLAFDELLALQVGMVARRRQRSRTRGGPIEIATETDARIRAAIVAALRQRHGAGVGFTTDQEDAILAIRGDLAGGAPMLRLLQGDVGSGKTAVAAWALAAAALAGRQSALLAPTDLLARQHGRTIADMLGDVGLPVELLVGSRTAADARAVRGRLASGEAPIVVGTHALMSESVAFRRLGLVIVDEQHRFGVDQRAALESKASDGSPHVLLMTATPIPRTLGQVVYADLDVTDLRAAPEGRTPITTGIRHPSGLDGTWARVRAEAAEGRRSFVVVPLIGEGDDAEEDAPGAEAEAARLASLLAPLRVGMVHGRLRAADRDAEMARFRDGDLDVLVGTTVIEVGVDVPEATMMVIEGADRFGLAQLHQLRGRVGRGRSASFCVLVSDAASPDEWRALVDGRRSATSTEQARLLAVRATTSGFTLAERDWELRREGDVLGLAQSGLPRLRVASIARPAHQALAVRARRHAEALLGDDGSLRGGAAALGVELATGWLARVADGEAGESGDDAPTRRSGPD